MMIQFLNDCCRDKKSVVCHLSGGSSIPILVEGIHEDQWVVGRNREFDSILIRIDQLVAVCSQ